MSHPFPDSSDATTSVVFLNGRWLPRHEAALDIEDRGTLFADGVYEVIRAFGSRLYLPDEHLTRLQKSMTGLRFPECRIDHLPDISLELCQRNNWTDAAIYWQITRGPARRDRRFPDSPKLTTLVMARADQPLDPAAPVSTLKAVLQPDCRWARCWIKSLMLLDNVLAAQAAADQGADEAIYDRDGRITEGTATNVFAVRHQTLFTPPPDSFILRGITRDRVLELAAHAQIPAVEQRLTPHDLLQADEVFLTGTTLRIAAVTQIDHHAIGNSTAGPVTAQLADLLNRDIARQCGLLISQ